MGEAAKISLKAIGKRHLLPIMIDFTSGAMIR